MERNELSLDAFAAAWAAEASALVAERRAAIREWAQHETPPALGVVPDVIDDPAIVMLWGITRDSLDAWLSAWKARP